MYSYTKATVCTAVSGTNIGDFAQELLELHKKEKGVLVGVFNNIALFVHSKDTVQDIIDQYYEKR